MEHLLNDNVKQVEISGIRKFFNMVNDKKDILSLTIGQPDFHTPEHIKQAAHEAIDQNHTTYTHNAGIISLRKAIATQVFEDYQLDYHPENEIIVTAGASQAIDISLRTIIQPGDEVILPGPVYPGYEPLIKLAGATPVYIDTRETNFKITPKQLEGAITNKTKCVILPYPSNPTGVTLTKDELIAIAEVLKGKEIFVIADEIYSKLTYETPHFSIAAINQMKQQTIVINGLSKSHAMTGWRIGYVLAPGWLSKHILKVHQYNVSCATSISQYAALEALKNGKEDPTTMRKDYHKRRDYVFNRLVNMGMEVVKPNGAFYFFPKIQSNKDSFQFAFDLVNEAGVALVPGSAFSHYGAGYVRLSYAYSMETLEKGLNRLEQYLQKREQ
ncbi:putative N-acetyl-LL-diaminopimelate aminotransferase [Paraliobacillus ryukyuensis]|uniref:Aminotransferase n=1 Tax=Paraliobacillus ryukyuensis TaxID=200904 RepID=A0A366DWR3_9BACI|nr:aminotransferase A [Paraliobacillus ryukyuensis]RBO94523.1 aminotransferase [Paraliobacillus ryukyuensis]